MSLRVINLVYQIAQPITHIISTGYNHYRSNQNRYWKTTLKQNLNKNLVGMTAYYGILQTLHLLTLAWAGIQILSGNPSPFPILPPPGGWDAQTMSFMFGLAATDFVGIILGMLFAYQMLFKGNCKRTLGLVSLTIFITGAIVFAAGTIPSGAWGTHPCAYWIMALLFAPTVFLFFQIIKTDPQ